MNLHETVIEKLTAVFKDPTDKIVFEDERGDGHHFHLVITSSSFNNLSRLERRRKVYAILEDMIGSGDIHALRMTLQTN